MDPKIDQLDTSIRVVTPENISFRYQLAGPFRRLPAFLIDFAIRIGVVTGLAFVSNLFGLVGPGLGQAFLLISWFVLSWFYGALFETYFSGQTPGKWITGLRVLTVDGRPINGMQAVLRNVLRTADMFPPPASLVGLIVASLNRRYQRLGDLVAGTIVIVEQRSRLAGVAEIGDQTAIALAAMLPSNVQIGRGLARCLISYVDRRSLLSMNQRREIAQHLAEPLLTKYELPPDTSYDMLLCALYYRAFVADRVNEEELGMNLESPFASKHAEQTVGGGSL